jgi:hypothetical protein
MIGSDGDLIGSGEDEEYPSSDRKSSLPVQMRT